VEVVGVINMIINQFRINLEGEVNKPMNKDFQELFDIINKDIYEYIKNSSPKIKFYEDDKI